VIVTGRVPVSIERGCEYSLAPVVGLCFFVSVNTAHLGQRETVAKHVMVDPNV